MASVKWKEASIRTIKVAQTLLARTENDLDNAIATDPLPTIRDRCVRETNRKIHDYARSVRAIVIQLRQCFAAVNTEIKSMNRTKESLYKFLNTIRRLLTINVHSVQLRQERPHREKKLADNADESLQYEYQQLVSHKQLTETQLHAVLANIQALGHVRANLSAILQERSRTTDLICHSFSSSQNGGRPTRNYRHVQSFSAPATTITPPAPQGDIDPVTPAVKEVLSAADSIINSSHMIKKESIRLMDDLNKQQMILRDIVNDHIVQRIAQTATLNQHLTVNNGETKVTLQTAQRYLNTQEKSHCYSMGPVSSRDITIREKLDRPIVRVYQTHPGTDLPEAMHLISNGNRLTESITITQKNIALLKLARRKMKEDTRGKEIAMDVDSNVLRMRKREGEKRLLLLGTSITPIKKPVVVV